MFRLFNSPLLRVNAKLSDMASSPIQLCSYDPMWAIRFSNESQCLQNLLCNSIERISHVGSTSIPGIKAKPILDIVLESKIFPPTEKIIESLLTLEYENQGESGVPERCWFIKGKPRQINLHWCPIGGVVPRSQIAFRDKLRNDIKLAHQYEKIKIAGAPGQDIDSQTYADAKSEFIAYVLSRVP